MPYIIRKEFARICKLSESTVLRKINLIGEGKLTRPAVRHAGFYFPVTGVHVSAHTVAAQNPID